MATIPEVVYAVTTVSGVRILTKRRETTGRGGEKNGIGTVRV